MFSLSPPLSPSIAYLWDKRHQIADFHLKELSPDERQGIGRPASDPKYPAITRANGTTMTDEIDTLVTRGHSESHVKPGPRIGHSAAHLHASPYKPSRRHCSPLALREQHTSSREREREREREERIQSAH
ncbi:hypothetical protein NQZ68_035508 [Dissostichus eleginoides]|nr:hypothetical protein NQZ68_035508 [Dissostichus eleginoides]